MSQQTGENMRQACKNMKFNGLCFVSSFMNYYIENCSILLRADDVIGKAEMLFFLGKFSSHIYFCGDKFTYISNVVVRA